ncbi:multicopper oxidase mco domain protein [Lentilactobacillus parafarraginis F0439]|uniref:Multicopper oxidase mco domain protein n=1 Tax=Lentilactobacillus parafarraginis F0439 TaxID=797515 RepID=G9ZMN6_9LACO|nr:multicopper oxidase domain-containing protein [Lentilactobacillus parafarraginis]EHL99325.1 multicopper oxidase mco domain protein [Lentilactobacillus parafarraginis F0439]
MKKKTAWIIIGVIIAIIVIGNVGWFVQNQHRQQSTSSNRSGMMSGSHMGSSGRSMMGGNSSGRARRNSDEAVPLKTANTAPKKLAVPPILKPTKTKGDAVYYTLKAKQASTTFKPGVKTQTMGYNGSYLGPTIRVKRGQTVHTKVVNQLNQRTSLHWHGALIPGKADGGPLEPIAAGKTKQTTFKVDQQAATLWYHPHAMGTTASQVYHGLAGFMLVDDQNSQKLKLPKKYGVDDFPVVVQDRTFSRSGQFSYQADYNADGTEGNTLLVNGTLNPYINVKTNQVRLRLLNGSNARTYHFTLNHGATMRQIATDGGFLNHPVKMSRIDLAPGQRAEVVVNTAGVSAKTLALRTNGQRVLQLRLNQKRTGRTTLPKTLNHLTPTGRLNQFGLKHQTIRFSGMGRMVRINDRVYNPNRIDLTAKPHSNQIWTLTNNDSMMGGMDHPFHIHGAQFRILSINGKRPSATQSGLMDVVNLKPDQKVRVLISFHDRGIFVYHCHNLEHEENGMMGQVKVE